MYKIFFGTFLSIVGILVFIKGKIPFIKTYHGVHQGKEALHCRIESLIIFYIGIVFVLWKIMHLSNAAFVILLIIGCLIGFGLEIVLHVIN